jgi:DNA repair exonuclease SbcCD ATPase subunit
MDLSRGSEWRKWDLHIHSPLSALNNQFARLADGTPDWEAYVSKLGLLADISAIGITDYFTIEGYRKIREFFGSGRLKNIALVLPNIEFRLDKIVNTARGPRRLNYHVIFSEKVPPEEIEEHFLHELKFCFEGDPQRADLSWSIRRTNLELLGKRLKQEHPRFNDGRSDFEIGCMNATVAPGTIKEVLSAKERIFKGMYLVVLAEENTALMDWDGQDHLTRKVLLQGADTIFSSNPRTIRWARGEGGLTADQVRAEFKSLKPCLHGSDAHRLEDIGHPAENRHCWIKSDPSFEGLKQVLYEPCERIFIGDAPPKLKHDYQVIQSVRIENAMGWFEPAEIPLNGDLVGIIGSRGSGKSALAEAIAFAGGASLFRQSDDIRDTFLYKASRKSTANPTPIVGARIVIRWRNGDDDTAIIPDTLRHGRDEEKVKYLPQKFVERLCAPENNRQLEDEIERVIFQRVSKTDRLDASNFQELRKASTRAVELKRANFTRTIHGLNQSIAETEARIALKPAKENELKRRREELQALLKNVPQVPQENQEELRRLDALTKPKHELETQIVRLSEQLTALDTIETRFGVLKDDVRAFNAEITELLKQVELEKEKDKFEVRLPLEALTVIAQRRVQVNALINLLKDGTGTAMPGPNLADINKQIEEIKAKSRLTEAKKKEYYKFQRDRQHLEEAIAKLDREVKEITDILIPRLKDENNSRIERYADCLELLKEERAVLECLYEPLRRALNASNEMARKLAFVSRTIFDVARHASRGAELLDRRKAVYRDQEDLERELRRFFAEIEEADFDREKTKAKLIALLDSFLIQDGGMIGVEEQLRKDRTARDFAEWFFSVEAFTVTYSIMFDGKDLQYLSPGDKGIVLLLLYLEAESEDNRPLVIDQPDDNLDNMSVYPSLIEYFRARKKTRQVIIITHNPNLVVNTDAEQVFVANFDGSRTPKITYRSGPLDDTNPMGPIQGIREEVCKILEGGTEAFQRREQRYALS